ncbi:hypothetical protein [Myroides odoratus]|uniref:hypothetical protein n=1 Tax=Myroides odoratus TaxID=256 RepID=UPI0039B11C77
MAFVIVSCDRENDSTINSLTEETSAYEQITNKFLASVEHEVQPGSKTTYGFWDKLWRKVKQIGRADAETAGTQMQGGNVNGALWGGIGASIIEIFQPLEPLPGYQLPADIFTGGLSNLKPLDDVAYPANKFDSEGYNHYVVINDLMNNMDALKVITDQEEQYERFKMYISTSLSKLYPTFTFDTTVNFLVLNRDIQLQPAESYTVGSAYYDRVFPFNGKESNPKFIQISQLYALSYETMKEEDVTSFVAYSKEMEQAVMNDKDLSANVKDVLLIKMATQRYGIKYYASLQ